MTDNASHPHMADSADTPDTIEMMMDIQQIARIIEARIFASPEPVSTKELLVYLRDEQQLETVIEMISERYDAGSGIELSKIEGGFFAFRTAPDIAPRLNIERQVKRPLSRAAMEVLAIIAYHQPITRSEIEEIRGISLSRGTVDILLELGWIKPKGRRRTPGRPLTWGTSSAFLDHFGLSSLSELPGFEELKSAGLLRKGQILAGVSEMINPLEDDRLDENLPDDDLLAEEFFDDDAALSDDEWGRDNG